MEPGTIPAKVVGKMPQMREILNLVEKASAFQCPILILGEIGAGKQLIARAIHEGRGLQNRQFRIVHCALEPQSFEEEVFGWFPPTANRLSDDELPGTIFLHEIASLPLAYQARIACLLRRNEFSKGSGCQEHSWLSPRIIGSSSCDPSLAVRSGKFSKDLYFLLSEISINLPPLRERKADIPLLSEAILRDFSISFPPPQSSPPRSSWILSAKAEKGLAEYTWPGNVRELKNCLRQATLSSVGAVIQHFDLTVHKRLSDVSNDVDTTNETESWRDLQLRAIKEAVMAAGGDKVAAARMLGIGKTTLYRKMQEYRKEGLLELGFAGRGSRNRAGRR